MESPSDHKGPVETQAPSHATLVEFEHLVGDKQYRLEVQLREQYMSAGKIQKIVVIDTNRGIVAVVRGAMSKGADGSTEFSAHASHNISGADKKSITYIPNVVSSTIGELVSMGEIKTWFSDHCAALSEDAIGLYAERLPQDPRLVVTEPSAQTQYRYMITAKPPTSQVK